MTTLEVIPDFAKDTMAAALVAVQEIHDGAMARFAEMHQDWHTLSRETLGDSLPWPSSEDLSRAA